MTEKPVEYYKVGEVVIHQGVPECGTHKGVECTIIEAMAYLEAIDEHNIGELGWYYRVDIQSVITNHSTILAKQEWLRKKHDKGTMQFDELIKSLDKGLMV